MTTTLTDLDPAFDAMKDFSQATGGTTQAIEGMRRKAIFTDGALSSKIKTLGAVLWAVSAKCEPCIAYYVRRAREVGVTKEELGEMLAVASTMGGCVGEMWALKAFHAFASNNAVDDSEPSCCET